MKDPLVSIITVSKDSEQFIEETIKSVLNQTYSNIEYIIIDGASTDSTLEIIQKYESKISCWISEPDTGMYSALNKGLVKVSGDIVAYINSDDLYHPDAVERAVGFFLSNPTVDCIYSNLDIIDITGKFQKTKKYPEFKGSTFICMNYSLIGQPASFWRRKVHDDVGLFDDSMKMAADFDFYCNLSRKHRILKISGVLAKHRMHPDTLTSRETSLSNAEVAMIWEKNKNRRWWIVYAKPILSIWGDIMFKLWNYSSLLKRLH